MLLWFHFTADLQTHVRNTYLNSGKHVSSCMKHHYELRLWSIGHYSLISTGVKKKNEATHNFQISIRILYKRDAQQVYFMYQKGNITSYLI